AIWAAVDLLQLTHRDKEACALFACVVQQPSTRGASQPADGEWTPIYSKAADPLAQEDSPADPPEEVGVKVDWNAELHRMLPGTVDTLDPLQAVESYEAYVNELLYDPLYVCSSTQAYSPNPAIVANATPSKDQKVWTIQLKDGLTWHD